LNVEYFKGIELYDNYNPRILEFYGGEKRVLDIGCGSGLLGKTIKSANANAIVYGIDYSEAARSSASKVLDRYDALDLDSEVLPQYDSLFDLIIMGDVLEHLKRPDNLLARLHALLTPQGSVVISVPNVAHFRIRKTLLAGRFRYTDTGILDRTHLKFFTRETLYQMISSCGYTVLAEKHISELPQIFGWSPRKGSSFHAFVTRKLPTLVAVQFVLKLQPTRGENSG
jgi:2-polyprenyl-3-methyl-5-hydroxy-6-metoxy-1,4-benzoquinol methylase